MKLLADENFNQHIVRAIRRLRPAIDLVSAQEVGLGKVSDPDILEWAANQHRVVLSHDVQTLIAFAFQRVEMGMPMPGVIIVRDAFNTRATVEDLLIIVECSFEGEMDGQVRYVPL